MAESGALHGRPAHKKENGPNAYASSLSSTSAVAGNSTSRRPTSYRLVLGCVALVFLNNGFEL